MTDDELLLPRNLQADIELRLCIILSDSCRQSTIT